MKKNVNGEKTYLDISTAHLTYKTFCRLNAISPPYTYKYDEGVFITIPDKSETDITGMSGDLRNLLRYAWNNNIDLIRMDCDAEIIYDLPAYDWEDDKENKKLAERIWSCLSDRYDDEEYKKETVPDIIAALEKGYTETLKLVLNRLCERIEDMEEE